MLPSGTFPRGVSTLHTDASGTAPPDAFGPFRVLHQIGVGVLGPVFRAYQPDPGRLVAVKQFRLDLPPEATHRFVAALDRLIAADLTHLGIAAPLAAGMTDNTPYLALDFVAAESFDVVMRDYGPAPATEALRIATQLGAALDFAAAVDVFHGALHPRDVLVSTDDTRVTGLGIAQALEQVGVAPPVRRPYTAPERLAGGPWDRRADIFSLAALVYEMLFGRRIAGVGNAAVELITAVDGADVEALRTVFARALAEDPTGRFDTALAFADALQNALSGPAAAPKPSKGRRKREADAAPAPSKAARTPRGPALPLDAAPDLPLVQAAVVHDLDLRPSLDEPAPIEPAPIEAARIESGDLDVPHQSSVPPIDAPPALTIDEPVGQLDPRAHGESFERPPAAPVAAVSPIEEPPIRGATPPAASERLVAPIDDLDLRRAEEERVTLAESTSALPETFAAADVRDRRDAVVEQMKPIQAEHDSPVLAGPTFSSVALEQSRSAIWPIALALVVGLLVGFAFGYGAGTRDRSSAASQSAEAMQTPPTAAPVPAPEVPVAPPPAAGTTAPSTSASSAASTPSRSERSAAPPSSAPAASAPGASAAARGSESSTARSRETNPERAAADIGRLLVRSSPAGARVSIDGREVGTTPATVRDLAPGTHVVRVAHQGYVTAERRVRIRSAQPAQSIEVELEATRPARQGAPAPVAPERTSGSLMVDSRPSGARVFVDGKMVGNTPLLLDAVSTGDHAVRLELDGFTPWTTTTRVAGGERARVSGSLEQR